MKKLNKVKKQEWKKSNQTTNKIFNTLEIYMWIDQYDKNFIREHYEK